MRSFPYARDTILYRPRHLHGGRSTCPIPAPIPRRLRADSARWNRQSRTRPRNRVYIYKKTKNKKRENKKETKSRIFRGRWNSESHALACLSTRYRYAVPVGRVGRPGEKVRWRRHAWEHPRNVVFPQRGGKRENETSRARCFPPLFPLWGMTLGCRGHDDNIKFPLLARARARERRGSRSGSVRVTQSVRKKRRSGRKEGDVSFLF